MKVKDVMTKNPVCCRSTDSAMDVAGVLRDKDIGSVPVISSESQQLEGIITDRDLCCGVLAKGLDAKTTTIASFVTRNPVACSPEDDIESCEKAMQDHQIRRAPVIDGQGRCVGIVAQADLALKLKDQPQIFQKTVAGISSRPGSRQPSAAA
jgi:CBS domain-containing protein